ncbi:hypothetical protein AVEN_192419-1 [Araneus ventricosus]|uniref:RNase H type-1 domain-containing protein n=1 Tax=Araneus ventricosus TaxID=182803 RepID=A0A4Y2N1V2_ARAVE|nr:hypothetical protein AVEN_192419-1 [Araneus ventricosus]
MFNETLRNDFNQYFIIATDASKSQKITSIAGVSEFSSFAFRIHHTNSIFTAICQAIDDLAISDKPLLVLTDSLSVQLALQHFSSKSPSVIHKLVHKLVEKSLTNNHITLLWIPGHSTILWNEKSDFIAKLVTEHSPYINWIAREDILSHMKHNSKKRT